jgi:hypothetical protein
MRKLFKKKDSQKDKGEAKDEASLGPASSSVEALGGLSLSDLHDREETKQRFVKASQTLEDALKVWKRWKYAEPGSTEFPNLAGEPERFDDEFRNKLEKIMETRKASLKDKSIWAKSGDTIVAIFTALSPFAKNFLSVAIQGQPVRPLWRTQGLNLDSCSQSIWSALRRTLPLDLGSPGHVGDLMCRLRTRKFPGKRKYPRLCRISEI